MYHKIGPNTKRHKKKKFSSWTEIPQNMHFLVGTNYLRR